LPTVERERLMAASSKQGAVTPFAVLFAAVSRPLCAVGTVSPFNGRGSVVAARCAKYHPSSAAEDRSQFLFRKSVHMVGTHAE